MGRSILTIQRRSEVSRTEILERIAQCASNLDMLLAEENGDVGDICEAEDALHEALRPWRALQYQLAGSTSDAAENP